MPRQKNAVVSLKEKIEEKEKAIKLELETLRNTLNELSIIQKSNPNDWAYLSGLGSTEIDLKALNEKLTSIRKSTNK